MTITDSDNNNTGTLTITDLHSTLNANLSNISLNNVTAEWSSDSTGNAAFTGSLFSSALSTRKVTISTGATMITSAAIVDEHFFNNTGTLSITDIASTLDAKFENISCSTTISDQNNNGTFTGTLF